MAGRHRLGGRRQQPTLRHRAVEVVDAGTLTASHPGQIRPERSRALGVKTQVTGEEVFASGQLTLPVHTAEPCPEP